MAVEVTTMDDLPRCPYNKGPLSHGLFDNDRDNGWRQRRTAGLEGIVVRGVGGQ